ncbi:MAG: hypothetical protein BAJATHORv1_40302 [Candidatus Thorarchaeota archaeon]|nr:MAG: hypothetical protein BAJATHORv1_40302 [Candidatus Thorarchaeota archaeon]
MKLLQPLAGKIQLKNRMVFLATHLGYCENGIVSKQLTKFYETRAKYHPGLIIVGGCYTEHLGMSSPTMIGISDDKFVPGLEKLVKIIHSYDVPVAAQLYHAGRYTHSLLLGQKAVSSSAVECRLTRETPRELSIDGIKTTVENFAKAAERAKEAGFDAVEILGSAGYLLNQFLAKATNHRSDEYGGDLRNRAKFPIEVITAIRKIVGKDYPIIYRISGDDFIPDGNTLEDNKVLVPWLVKAGIDVLDVTGGWHETRVPQITMDVPRGHYAYLAEALGETVDVPTIACNRINSPTIAEKILLRGKVDLIGMSRAFLADPAFPEKVRSDKIDRIRPCVACNQGCLDRVFEMKPVTCILNPEAGFETKRAISVESSAGNIAIVGAGPSGLEASRVLATRGFNITLFDSRNQIGGLLRFAARTPKRGEFASYLTYMQNELERLGVNMRLNTTCTADMLREEGYDSVFLASGFLPTIPEIDGLESPSVLSAVDLLENQNENLGQVVVMGGNIMGCSAALYANNHAESVYLFDSESRIGHDIGLTSKWVFIKALKDRDIEIRTEVDVTQYTGKYIMMSVEDTTSMFLADTLIVASNLEPNLRLVEAMKKTDMNFILLTDKKHALDLLSTIHTAYQKACSFKLDR